MSIFRSLSLVYHLVHTHRGGYTSYDNRSMARVLFIYIYILLTYFIIRENDR